MAIAVKRGLHKYCLTHRGDSSLVAHDKTDQQVRRMTPDLAIIFVHSWKLMG